MNVVSVREERDLFALGLLWLEKYHKYHFLKHLYFLVVLVSNGRYFSIRDAMNNLYRFNVATGST